MDLKKLHKDMTKELIKAFPSGESHGICIDVEIRPTGVKVRIWGYYLKKGVEEMTYSDRHVGLQPPYQSYTISQAVSAFRELLHKKTDNILELTDEEVKL